ncbi:hypothetical protein [Candidatus Allofournierella merdavium]|uniref:hypothetical protein n=1 Tax=Candidatus Allofournierella merdavium TaxID=2838593 RepID=UPI00374F9BC5
MVREKRTSLPFGKLVQTNGGIVLRNRVERFALEGKAMVIERQYGQYKVKICFTGQEDPNTPRKVMNAITQAFRNRVDRGCNETGNH